MSDVNAKGTRLSEHLVTVGDSNRMPYEETPPPTTVAELKDVHEKATNPNKDADAAMKSLRAGLQMPKRSFWSRLWQPKS